MATDTQVTNDTSIPEKKDNKKIFIILGIVAVALLCICSIAGVAIAMNSTESNDTEEFATLLDVYFDNSDLIDDQWKSEADACDKTEEYNVLAEAEYYEEEMPQLYEEFATIIDEEWACYKTLRQYELDLDGGQESDFLAIDCTTLDEVEQCETFIKDFSLLVINERDSIALYEESYENFKNDDVCYLDSLKNNFDDRAGQDLDDEVCANNSISLAKELDTLDEEYGNLADSLYEIGVDFLDTYEK